MDNEKDVVIKFEEVEKRIHSLNKKITTNSESINSANDSISSMQESIISNENDISSLQSDVGSINSSISTINTSLTLLSEELESLQSSGDEVFNCYEGRSFYFNKRGYNFVFSDRIYFLCNKSSKIKVNVSIDTNLYSTGATYNAIMYLMVNSTTYAKAVLSSSVSYSESTDHTFTFEYEFYPPQENNFLHFIMNSGNSNASLGNAKICSIKISAIGKNLIFLNRNNSFKAYISKNNYYLTKNSSNGSYYLKIPSSSVDLSSTFTQIPDLIPANVPSYANKYFPFNYQFLPKISYNSNTSLYEIDDTVDFFLFCIGINTLITSGATNPASGVASLVNWTVKGWEYSVGHPGNNDLNPRNLAITNSGNVTTCLPGLTNSDSSTSNAIMLSLNGTTVTGLWVANTVVFAKNWEDVSNNPYMCVATDQYGENYFFPARNASYKVSVGKGKQVNAYLQTDGSITIYMNWLRKVYKKTLIYNSETSQYELSNTVTLFDETSEILEGYGTDYFICDLNDNWSYVPAT